MNRIVYKSSRSRFLGIVFLRVSLILDIVSLCLASPVAAAPTSRRLAAQSDFFTELDEACFLPQIIEGRPYLEPNQVGGTDLAGLIKIVESLLRFSQSHG